MSGDVGGGAESKQDVQGSAAAVDSADSSGIFEECAVLSDKYVILSVLKLTILDLEPRILMFHLVPAVALRFTPRSHPLIEL